MDEQAKDDVRTAVREQYGNVARAASSFRLRTGLLRPRRARRSLALGYSAEDLAAVPEGANMGLGCGNPQAIAALRPARPCSTSAQAAASTASSPRKQVGATGRVIGVDMTADMITKARANAPQARGRRTSSSGSARSSTCRSPTASSM